MLIDLVPGLAWVEKSGLSNDPTFKMLIDDQRNFESQTLELLGFGHAA